MSHGQKWTEIVRERALAANHPRAFVLLPITMTMGGLTGLTPGVGKDSGQLMHHNFCYHRLNLIYWSHSGGSETGHDLHMPDAGRTSSQTTDADEAGAEIWWVALISPLSKGR